MSLPFYAEAICDFPTFVSSLASSWGCCRHMKNWFSFRKSCSEVFDRDSIWLAGGGYNMDCCTDELSVLQYCAGNLKCVIGKKKLLRSEKVY